MVTEKGYYLDAGKASLELIDSAHAEAFGSIEVGKRIVGPVRLAFNIGDAIATGGDELMNVGAAKMAEVKQAPWSRVQRMKYPAGMQLTLFETSTLFDGEIGIAVINQQKKLLKKIISVN